MYDEAHKLRHEFGYEKSSVTDEPRTRLGDVKSLRSRHEDELGEMTSVQADVTVGTVIFPGLSALVRRTVEVYLVTST